MSFEPMIRSLVRIYLGAIVIVLSVLLCASKSEGQSPIYIKADPRSAELETIDLEEWVRDYSLYGITSFRNGEMMMRAKRSDYFYVLVAPEDFSTERATTSVTLRNVSGAHSRFGSGIIFHSDPTPLRQDYVFVIDTSQKRFRVLRHSNNHEMTLAKWMASPFINSGKQENTLAVRDLGSTTELYVNGHLVGSVENTFAFKSGVPGLYTDAVNVAFKDFTIDHKAGLPKFK